MPKTLAEPLARSLERSCGSSPGDWIRCGTGVPGLTRIEAFFSGHAYDPHRHDTYALGLTVAGVQCFDYRGAARASLAGNAIVLHPDERHDGRAGISAGFCYRMLYLEPSLVQRALGDAARPLPFIAAAVLSEPTLVRAIGRALADIDLPLAEIEADALISGLAEAMAALDPVTAPPRAAIAAGAAGTARSYLDANLDRAVSSAELETITGLDRFAMTRHFRARFGTSPYNYLVMRRLDRARSLLRDGLSLADAAFACGFADQSHFTRQFRRGYGITPGRWCALNRTSTRHRDLPETDARGMYWEGRALSGAR